MATRVKNVGNWRIMPDATLAASYQAYKRCQNRRPDKAFTPHPAISNEHRDYNLPQWFRQH
ncbi:hypothetical protein O3T00_35375, partial [Escherichia coli]|uniref:hypothetical protein n=1 Tax=Escherichia coli TaxID=562 RepID=UPI002738ED46